MPFSDKIKNNGLYIAIAIVALLLAISVCMLIFLPHREGSSSSLGNVIHKETTSHSNGPTSSDSTEGEQNKELTSISLRKVGDVLKNDIIASNMFPGDTVVKEYEITLSNANISAARLGIDFSDRDESGALLSDVMNIKVISSSETLFDGELASAPREFRLEAKDGERTIDLVLYLSLDTSVGNEYQDKSFLLDLSWWVDESDIIPANTTTPSESTDADPSDTLVSTTPSLEDISDEEDSEWRWIIPLILVVFIVIVALLSLCASKKKREKIASFFKKILDYMKVVKK